ncbi:MAG: hypothetical protein HQ450_13780 [Alcaligenaceae bacterium]|nr:hypothetical protein [Alcaligenaceae bacterium]
MNPIQPHKSNPMLRRSVSLGSLARHSSSRSKIGLARRLKKMAQGATP